MASPKAEKTSSLASTAPKTANAAKKSYEELNQQKSTIFEGQGFSIKHRFYVNLQISRFSTPQKHCHLFKSHFMDIFNEFLINFEFTSDFNQ